MHSAMNRWNYFDKLAVADSPRHDLMRNCFDYFLSLGENLFDLQCFGKLTDELFVNSDGHSYSLTEGELKRLFDVFDANRDGEIDDNEFRVLWNDFIQPIVRPKSALIVIDVQNDFIDGSLAIRNCPAKQEGFDVVKAIDGILPHFETVFYTYDWHPEDHISFIDNVSKYCIHENSLVKAEKAKVFDTVLFEGNPEFEQKLWPRHCVQNTWGSELNSQLEIADGSVFIYKGTSSTIDSYSAFWDNQKKSQTSLNDELKSKSITDVFVCGLAYDYCVGSTALHALEFGYRTVLIQDACRGVDLNEITKMKKDLISKQAAVINSDELPSLIKGIDRRLDLGLFIVNHIIKTSDHCNGALNDS